VDNNDHAALNLRDIYCPAEVETHRIVHHHDRFFVRFKDKHCQVRLDPDGSVFLSWQDGHVSTHKTATITLDQFHAVIIDVITKK
jgi:hypothetical protein